MKSKVIIGLILIIGGILIALSSLNIMPFENYYIKIGIAGLVGVYGLYQLFFKRNIFWGGLVISLSGMYILKFFVEDAWKFFVPLILIFLGLEFIFSKTGIIKAKNNDNMTHDDFQGDRIQVSSVLSGNGKRVVSSHFKGGSVSAYLGGTEVDLTSAIIAPEGAILTVRGTCAFGGVSFKYVS